MKTSPWCARAFTVIGLFWVCLGFALNEWTVPIILDIDPLGSRSLLLVRTLDLAVITWGLCTLRWHAQVIIQKLNLFACMTLLVLAFAEVTLRAFPTILGHEFATGILGKYHTRTGGIYYYDPVLRMLFMEPNRTEQMYYYGYTWVHQTDKFGFRNFRTVSDAKVVLLGNSFIYGHGVDINKTVAYFVEKLSGHSVANLAREGDSPVEEAYKLTEYLQQFGKPRYVLYFFCEDDLNTLRDHGRTDQELLQFVNTPLADIKYKPRADINAAIKARDEQNYFQTHAGPFYSLLKQRLYLLKALDWVDFTTKTDDATGATENGNVNNPESIEWKYTKKAILYMNHLSKIHGSRVIIAPITPTREEHYTILENFAREQKIDFIDTRAALDQTDPGLRLPTDGHFSEEGARTMAQIVVTHLTRNP